MIKIDGVALDLNNLPESVQIQEGGYIEQIKDAVKTIVTKPQESNKMLDLNYHNTLRYEMHSKPISNAAGIACPKCGKEMQYTYLGMLLLSYPPKMSLHCECGHNDYKVC